MATWEQTKSHLREKFLLAVDEPAWIGLGWKFKAKNGVDDVVQRQRIELAQAFGQPHVIVMSDIVPVEKVPERVVLVHNMTLAIGAIAISEGVYVLRAVLPLDGVSFEHLDRVLEYVAHEAARLRESTPP
ncbi:MAG: hypothetical protein ACKV2T_06990 [Kofleriaceae bacterium]